MTENHSISQSIFHFSWHREASCVLCVTKITKWGEKKWLLNAMILIKFCHLFCIWSFFFFIFPTSYFLLGHIAGKYVDSLNHEGESIKKPGILDVFFYLLFFAANAPIGTDAVILSLEVELPWCACRGWKRRKLAMYYLLWFLKLLKHWILVNIVPCPKY